jgi:hypothetical protein
MVSHESQLLDGLGGCPRIEGVARDGDFDTIFYALRRVLGLFAKSSRY